MLVNKTGADLSEDTPAQGKLHPSRYLHKYVRYKHASLFAMSVTKNNYILIL
jgi:hypothetical protein